MLLKSIYNILKLNVTRIVIINVVLYLANVIAIQYKQKSKMLVDFDYLVSQLYVQHCTFVEVGEGVCSLFVELTLDLGSSCKKLTTRQMFFGNCLCSEFRGWQLCSHQLTLQRPDDCVFEEGVDCPSTSARVHRRLCDVTGMSQWNTQCNCSVSLAGMQQEPLCGFRTCFANPMPASICTPRTVCGTARCDISLQGSLYAVKCDRRCKDHQSFCEQMGPATSEKRMVTSEWTGWQSLCNQDNKASIQQFEAECLDNEGKPAFDCIGPGQLCCGLEEVDCICEVKQEDGHLKVFRYSVTLLSSKESEHLSVRVRSVGSKGQAKVWNRLIDVASKEDESDSLFSSQKLNDMRKKDKLRLEPLSIEKVEPKGNQINVHSTNILYENISQILNSTIPSNTRLIATIVSNSDLQNGVSSFFNQLSELTTPLNIIEKPEKINNLTNSLLTSLQHSGRHKNVSLEVEKDSKVNSPLSAIKNNPLDSETKVQSSNDNTEIHEQIKEEISQYHFTVNPNAEPKKLTNNTGKAPKSQSKNNLYDNIVEENRYLINQTHDTVEDRSKNENKEENKNIIVENKQSLKETLQNSSSHKEDINPETNEEAKRDYKSDINTLEGKRKHPKSIDKASKDSLTDNEIPMEYFFQNEIDYNAKSSDSNTKMIRNETEYVNSTNSHNKPNQQRDENTHSFSQIDSDEQKRTNSLSDGSNLGQYTTTRETNLTSPFIDSAFTLTTVKSYLTSKKVDESNSVQKVNDDTFLTKTNVINGSTEAKSSKKKGKYENAQDDECISISESQIPLTNQTNSNNTIGNNTTNTAKGSSETNISSEERELSTVPISDSTTACTPVQLDSKPKVSSNLYSKQNNTTDNPLVTKFSSISQPQALNITDKETQISQKESTQGPSDNVIRKLNKPKEYILTDQALQTVSNMNPASGLQEDGSNSQNSLYDEPEPVLKDLDKDDVDDNMADVLNNMIGMKHHHDKLTLTQKKGDDRNISSKEDKRTKSKNIKNYLKSKGFASGEEDLEIHEQAIKAKKTKKKVH